MVLIEGLFVVAVGLALFIVSGIAFGGARGRTADFAAGSHWWWDFGSLISNESDVGTQCESDR